MWALAQKRELQNKKGEGKQEKGKMCVHKSISFCFITIDRTILLFKPYFFQKNLSNTVTTIP
jgi:hypothetical protein